MTESLTIQLPQLRDPQLRVLLRPATAKDAAMTAVVLERAGIEAHTCADLPELLRGHPVAILPYLITREGFIQRVHDQRTGYWKADGEGVDPVGRAQWAAALDLLAGGRAEAFAAAGEQLLARGEPAVALRIVDCALLTHPDDPSLAELRGGILRALVERHQLFSPFRFAYYAGLAGLTVESAG